MELYLQAPMWDSTEGKLNCDIRIILCFAPGRPQQFIQLFLEPVKEKNNIFLLARNRLEQQR
jgi:hypothetical protein